MPSSLADLAMLRRAEPSPLILAILGLSEFCIVHSLQRGRATSFPVYPHGVVGVVLGGIVKEAVTLVNRRATTRALVSPFGVIASAFDAIPRQVHVEAIRDAQLAVIDWQRVTQLSERELLTHVRVLASEVARALTIRERLRLNMSARSRYELLRDSLGELFEDVPLYEVATFLGITASHLSRIRRPARRPKSR
jgi:hypothetical protein